MKNEVLDENQASEKSILANISKKTNSMRILMLLVTDFMEYGAYYTQEIADALHMNENTAYKNLNKLVAIGLLEKTEPAGNKREKYYSVLDRKLAEKAIEKYKRWVSFCLARLVPYQPQYASQLKQDKRFINTCAEYGLSVSEGLNAILCCHKIAKKRDGEEIVIWREVQGYDSEE